MSSFERERVIIEASILLVTLLLVFTQIAAATGLLYVTPEFIPWMSAVAFIFIVSALFATAYIFLDAIIGKVSLRVANTLRMGESFMFALGLVILGVQFWMMAQLTQHFAIAVSLALALGLFFAALGYFRSERK